jgi:tRNA A-37 threonylcarbamoyl transferase component Bud32
MRERDPDSRALSESLSDCAGLREHRTLVQSMADNPLPQIPRRYTASQLPVDADPAEKEFLGLLHNALAPSYVLIRRLGAGGMGTVYVARDPVLKRLVAVKVMSPELSKDPGARARFQREAQAVAAISHPNVVSVYAVGELENGLPYLVMQYVEGRSMAERIAEDGPLDVATAKRVLGEVASALSATHKKGIIHRDIKPANILWDDDAGRALVTDFGIAAVLERPDEQGKDKLTAVGTSVGTPAYMSPEQLLAEPVTEKSDIYALGLLGYELMIGEGPYAISSPREMTAAHLRDEPRKLSALKPDVDPELEQLLAACLTKDPTKRPSAEHVAGRLTHGASVLLEWPPPGLEDFSARLNAAMFAMLLGALLISVPLLVMSTLEADFFLREAMPSAGAKFVLTLVGVLAFVVGGGFGLGSLFRDAQRAVARGYGWRTVAEAAFDLRGDTGALIAGGREYAALSPAERNAMRARRLAAGGMRLAGATMPMVGYVAWLPIAVRVDGGAGWLFLGSIGMCALLLIVARVAGWMEEWQLRKSRARLAHARSTRADASRLGDSWTQAFDSARAGQRLGAGLPAGAWTNPWIVRLAFSLVAIVVAFSMAVSYSVAAIGSGSEILFGMSGSVTSSVVDRIRKIKRLERLALPIDASITPLRAGQAMTVMTTQRDYDRSSSGLNRYVQQVRRLPTALRDSLRLMASEPALQGFRMLARARTYDRMGASMSLAALDSLDMHTVPIPKFAPLQNVSFANVGAGVLAQAEGRTAEAEMRFRETLSVGFLLIREGSTAIENLIGAVIVGRARVALDGLYQQMGRASDAAFVSPAADPVDSPVPERALRLDQQQVQIAARRVLRDTNMTRGLRLEMLNFTLAYAPCGDLNQILFGVNPQLTLEFENARKSLVRFPSDSVLFLKASRALERPMRNGFGMNMENSSWYSGLVGIARIVDFLTGSRRMESCVSMLS